MHCLEKYIYRKCYVADLYYFNYINLMQASDCMQGFHFESCNYKFAVFNCCFSIEKSQLRINENEIKRKSKNTNNTCLCVNSAIATVTHNMQIC